MVKPPVCREDETTFCLFAWSFEKFSKLASLIERVHRGEVVHCRIREILDLLPDDVRDAVEKVVLGEAPVHESSEIYCKLALLMLKLVLSEDELLSKRCRDLLEKLSLDVIERICRLGKA